ncbi:MAG: chemotaxis protein MotB [Halioglobus sp.]|jgi:chemotaxis protein MotB
MARRRRRVEDVTNHERWLVSYADFITLLFAFFVVMYSISSVNEDKYRVLGSAMTSAFRDSPSSLDPITLAQMAQSTIVESVQLSELSNVSGPTFRPPLMYPDESELDEPDVPESKDESFSQSVLDAAEAEVNAISENVETHMESLIEDDIINIKRNKFWLEVEIKSSLLFRSGSSSLIPESVPVLVELSGLFVDMPNRIHIEGFTDDKPISTRIFPSNWELSSARAAAVVRLFETNGIGPARLASIGYSQYQPISDNDSEENRAKNRRVVVVVMASLEGRENRRIPEFELLKGESMASGEI